MQDVSGYMLIGHVLHILDRKPPYLDGGGMCNYVLPAILFTYTVSAHFVQQSILTPQSRNIVPFEGFHLYLRKSDCLTTSVRFCPSKVTVDPYLAFCRQSWHHIKVVLMKVALLSRYVHIVGPDTFNAYTIHSTFPQTMVILLNALATHVTLV